MNIKILDKIKYVALGLLVVTCVSTAYGTGEMLKSDFSRAGALYGRAVSDNRGTNDLSSTLVIQKLKLGIQKKPVNAKISAHSKQSPLRTVARSVLGNNTSDQNVLYAVGKRGEAPGVAAAIGAAGRAELPSTLPDSFTLDPKWRAEMVSRATPGSFGDTYAVYTVVSSASAEATVVYRHCGFFSYNAGTISFYDDGSSAVLFGGDIPFVIQHVLTIASIKGLSIQGLRYTDEVIERTLALLPGLESLDIWSSCFDYSQLARCLSTLHSLKHLSLGGADYFSSAELLGVLSRLTSLESFSSLFTGLDIPKLKELINALPPSLLKKLKINMISRPKDDDLEGIQLLLQAKFPILETFNYA